MPRTGLLSEVQVVVRWGSDPGYWAGTASLGLWPLEVPQGVGGEARTGPAVSYSLMLAGEHCGRVGAYGSATPRPTPSPSLALTPKEPLTC